MTTRDPHTGADQTMGNPDDHSYGNTSPTLPERLATDIAALGIGALCIIITITVVSRWLYYGLIPDDVLVIREIMVVVILLPLAAVSANRSQIAVSVFTNHLRGFPRRLLAAFGSLIGLIFVTMLLVAGLRMLSGSWETQDYYEGTLGIPMWLANTVYSVGLAAFLIRLAANLLRDIRALFPSSR